MIDLKTPFEIMSDFVELIEKERIRQNLKQSELYTKAGMSSSTYASFVKNKNTSFENIIKLLFALNMSANIQGLLATQKYISIDEIRKEQRQTVKKRVKKSTK